MLKRVIVKQQDQKDCGICCIESIVKYYDGYVPLEKIRTDTYSTKRGTTAFHIVECLKAYGFDAYGVRIKKEQFLKETFPLPAIVHVVLDNGLNHYMVLYEIHGDKVVLMDPSIGKKVLNLTDFFWIWSEVAIIAYPKTNILCYPKEKNLFLISLFYLGKHKRSFLRLLLLSIFLFCFSLLGSFFLKWALPFLNQKTESILIVLFFFTVFFFQILGMKGVLIEEKDLNKKLELTHTWSFLEHLFSLPLNTFKTREIGDYYTRLLECFDIKFLFSDVLKKQILSIGTITICFLFLYFIERYTFLFFLGISFLFFLIQVLLQKQNETIERDFIESKNRFSKDMLSEMESYETFIYLNKTEKQKSNIEKELISFLKRKEKKEEFYKKYATKQYLMKEGSHFFFLLLGLFLLSKEKIELIDFFLIEGIGSYLLNALNELSSVLSKWRYLKPILKKNYDFLWIEEEKRKKQKEDFCLGNLEIENVTFSYNQFHYAIKDFNLKVKEGEHVLLLGKSGCGKSTLCKLLVQCLHQMYGFIKVGGRNIADYSSETVRENIIYHAQKSMLINGTIRENILFHRPYDQTKFQRVCTLCHIEEIVAIRPLRYETKISVHENNLSGGEKQRILLARTLLTNGNIFLLDESLSEVDEKMEKEIIKELRKFLKGKTLLYISHKNYKALFDRVIKMEECHERVLIS